MLRLKYVGKLSHERIAAALGISKGVVHQVRRPGQCRGPFLGAGPAHERGPAPQAADL